MTYQKGKWLSIPCTPPVMWSLRQASRAVHELGYKCMRVVREFESEEEESDRHDVLEIHGQLIRALNELTSLIANSELCDAPALEERIRDTVGAENLIYSTDYFSLATKIISLNTQLADIIVAGWDSWARESLDAIAGFGEDVTQEEAEGVLRSLTGHLSASFERGLELLPAPVQKEAEVVRKSALLGMIEEMPQSTTQLSESLKCSRQNTLSHIQRLKKEGRICMKEIKVGNVRTPFYAPAGFTAAQWRDFEKSLRPPESMSMAEMLKVGPEDFAAAGSEKENGDTGV